MTTLDVSTNYTNHLNTTPTPYPQGIRNGPPAFRTAPQPNDTETRNVHNRPRWITQQGREQTRQNQTHFDEDTNTSSMDSGTLCKICLCASTEHVTSKCPLIAPCRRQKMAAIRNRNYRAALRTGKVLRQRSFLTDQRTVQHPYNP